MEIKSMEIKFGDESTIRTIIDVLENSGANFDTISVEDGYEESGYTDTGIWYQGEKQGEFFIVLDSETPKSLVGLSIETVMECISRMLFGAKTERADKIPF